MTGRGGGHAYLAGLIGIGVRPSLTPVMHMAEAAAQGFGYVYRTIDLAELGLPPESVTGLVGHARLLGFDALNITHPCKRLVIPALDALDPRAAELDAVNTVVFGAAGAVGHNTDWSGFGRALDRFLPDAALGQVVQVGAGGAGAAVGHALLSRGLERLVVVDVDTARAAELTGMLGGGFGAGRLATVRPGDLPGIAGETDGFVHCTPTGMAGHPGSAVDTTLLKPAHWVADIVYRPLDTALVRRAREIGCRVMDGGGMAVYQAVDAFQLITGVTPDADRMYAHFRRLAAAAR
jgi:shikimate dehydrogenase